MQPFVTLAAVSDPPGHRPDTPRHVRSTLVHCNKTATGFKYPVPAPSSGGYRGPHLHFSPGVG